MLNSKFKIGDIVRRLGEPHLYVVMAIMDHRGPRYYLDRVPPYNTVGTYVGTDYTLSLSCLAGLDLDTHSQIGSDPRCDSCPNQLVCVVGRASKI